MTTQYWRISPGQGGFLWREQKLNECIALGWSETGSANGKSGPWLRRKLESLKWPGLHAYDQLADFIWNVQTGDKVVASTSAKGIYALGTVTGGYQFNSKLWYKHSREVNWETTFWHPVDIDDLGLDQDVYNKFHGQTSWTIRNLDEREWKLFYTNLSRIHTPFRNLSMWGGLIQSPEYEGEVIILFSQMLQHLGMRIAAVGTRFPDAIVERKHHGKWVRITVEFELYSSGFRAHLHRKEPCDAIVCWQDDDWGRDNGQKRRFEIIGLKHQLEKIL